MKLLTLYRQAPVAPGAAQCRLCDARIAGTLQDRLLAGSPAHLTWKRRFATDAAKRCDGLWRCLDPSCASSSGTTASQSIG